MNQTIKIVIIGAGLAGLAAAGKLSRQGFDVLIVEARDRLGGRIATDQTLGIKLGLGANWIHGTEGNPLTPLAQDAQTVMGVMDTSKFLTCAHHEMCSENDVIAFDAKFQKALKQIQQLPEKSTHDTSLLSALTKFISINELSSAETVAFERQLRSIESYLGADCGSLSARHWDIEDPFPGDNSFLISSYEPLLNQIAQDLTVRLNTTVKKIVSINKTILIHTDDDIIEAHHVIVTVPLGVLKKSVIAFEPPLPDDKLNAINHLGMGLLNITAMRFDQMFWPAENHAMFLPEVDNSSIPVFFNLGHFIDTPILIGLTGGVTAQRVEALTDEDLIKKTIRNFRQYFKVDVDAPVAHVNTRWSQDTFSYGSYSYMPVGSSIRDIENLSKPIDNLIFFAGEATSEKHPATTHGAYLSGLREADRIIKLNEKIFCSKIS